jgi:hypothetical protein
MLGYPQVNGFGEKMLKKYRIELGALTEVPVWEYHKRGKNWCAVITRDPKSPGGLGRQFLKFAYGEYFYLLDGLEVGVPVEFGADYYSSGGVKRANRRYGRVVEITDSELVLDEYNTSKEVFAI